MSWQRRARWGFAGVGLTTAVLLVVLSRDRPTVEPAERLPTIDPAATSESGAGIDTRYVLEEKRWELSYGRARLYPDDRVQWDDVQLLFAEDGTEVRADHCEAEGLGENRQPARLSCEGAVRVTTGEGVEVEGDRLRYNEQTELTEMSGPVRFVRGRLSGEGTGAAYERLSGTFRLLADARVVIQPAQPAAPDATGSPDVPVEATAGMLVFNRATNAILLEGQARITTGPDEMTSDIATLYFDETDERFRVIELRGQARVQPGAESEALPEMHARDIDLSFHEGTQALERAVLSQNARLVDGGGRRSIAANIVSLQMAPDGVTLTHLEASGQVIVELPAEAEQPARRIEAASLLATGSEADEGLSDASFGGGVCYVEGTGSCTSEPTAAAGRTGRSQTLRLGLGGQLDQIERAEFQQDVLFRDGDVEGQADVGIYVTGPDGSLTLEPASASTRRAPLVTDAERRVEASRRITVALASHDLLAEGEVRTVSRRTSGQDDGLLSGTESVYGFSDRFASNREAGTVRYEGGSEGRARLQQGEHLVQAEEIIVEEDEGRQDLHAEGDVRSVVPLAEADGATTNPYVATAATMDYASDAETVTYTGAPARLETPDGVLEAARVVLTLGEGRTLEALDAAGDPDGASSYVRLTLDEGQEAVSDTLAYEHGSRQYTLAGRPFVLRTRDEDGTCSESRGARGQFTPGSAASVPPGEANPGGVFTQRVVSCTGPLNP